MTCRTRIQLLVLLLGATFPALAQRFAHPAPSGGWYLAEPGSFTVERRSADLATVLWRRSLGGSSLRSLAASRSGEVYVLGQDAANKLVLYALDSSGETRWARQWNWGVRQILVEESGLLILGGEAGRLALLNSTGDILRETKINIGDAGEIAALATAPDGSLYLAGTTQSSELPVSAWAVQKERRGGQCTSGFRVPFPYPCNSGWVARLHPGTWELEALSYLGGTAENSLTGLAFSRSGDVVAVGHTTRGGTLAEPYPVSGGALHPPLETVRRVRMTITRLSAHLNEILDSTWLTGSEQAFGSDVAIDDDDRVIVGGTSSSPDFPAVGAWNRVCGPGRGLNVPFWGVAVRLTPRLDRVENVVQTGTQTALPLLDLDTRATCLMNAASFELGREAAGGQIMTLIGGPFTDADTLTLAGVPAPILYRDENQINFVLPRTQESKPYAQLQLQEKTLRTLDLALTRPRWKLITGRDGQLGTRGASLIDSRRADGSQASDNNGFAFDEEIRAYATGIDLARPLRLFAEDPATEVTGFTAAYVPGTFEGVVEIRFRHRWRVGGAQLLFLENGPGQTDRNPGYIWLGPPPN